MISSTLFGRNNEAKVLREAYDACFAKDQNDPRQRRHMVLIHGSSGSGKTALAAQALRPLLAKQNGLFLSGKADATAQWSRPYAVFVSAFQKLLQLIEQQNDSGRIQQIRDAIVKEFGGDDEQANNSDDGALLSIIIPGFEKVLSTKRSAATSLSASARGSPESVQDTSGTDAVARLQYLLSRLCHTISRHSPLVLFLDDIQWCDRASLNLLKNSILSPHLLANSTAGSSCSPLLVVCAFRDDEEYHTAPEEVNLPSRVDEAKKPELITSPLSEFLEECRGTSPASLLVHDICLRSVDETTLNEIISGVYGLPQIEFYSQLIFKISSGNIYIALQCVRQLCEEGLLYRCEESKEWKWDFSQLQAQDDATAQFLLNPAFSDIVRHSITQLSDPTKHVLSVASCFGMEIDKDMLAKLFRDESDVVPSLENSLEEATNEGLIVLDPIIGRFAFSHDRVQQAAHALIDDVDAMSFEVGYKLWKQCSSSALKSNIFAIVTLLNKGQSFAKSGDSTSRKTIPDDECYVVARLNLEAGEKAVSIAAFSDATRYLEHGVALLLRGRDEETYWNDEYQLTLDLLSATAEVQMFNRNFERVDKLIDEVCKHVKCLDDKFRVQMTRINATSLQGKVQEAIDIGTTVLRQLGEKMPSRATSVVMLSEQLRTKLALRGKSKEALMALPPMQDAEKIAASHVINTMFYFATVHSSCYTMVLATKSIHLCLKYGTFAGSAMSFTMYAFALCSMGNIEEGFQFGELAMALLDRYKNRRMLPCVHAFYYYGVHHRKRPLRESIEGFKKGVQVAMEIGDIENAMINDGIMNHHSLFMGCKLDEVESRILNGLSRRKVHDHPVTHDLLQILKQTVDSLVGGSPYVNVSEFVEAVGAHTLTTNVDVFLSSLYHHSAFLAYIFRDYESAHDMVGKNTKALRKLAVSTFFGLQIEWVDALTSVAMARERKSPRANMANAKRILKQMSRRAQECPCNCGHMASLLKAEYESISIASTNCMTANMCPSVMEHYDSAIEMGSKEGFFHVAALAAERAGDCMISIGNADAAQHYWDKAQSYYQEWGASSKARLVATLMMTTPEQSTVMEKRYRGSHQVKCLVSRRSLLRRGEYS